MKPIYLWTSLAFIGWPKTQHQVAVHASGKRRHPGLDIQRQQPGRALDIGPKPLHPLPAHHVGQYCAVPSTCYACLVEPLESAEFQVEESIGGRIVKLPKLALEFDNRSHGERELRIARKLQEARQLKFADEL